MRLSGRLVERNPLRYTPAGVPVSEARLEHAGEVSEAGMPRQLKFEVAIKALGENARWLEGTPLGVPVEVEGFLATKSQNSRQLVLHVTTIEYLEGNENG